MPHLEPPEFIALNPHACARLVSLRAAVVDILANNLLSTFTDHSVVHSDNLVGLVNELTAPIAAEPHDLNEDERIVLYASCYLHDIGLQYQRAQALRVIPAEQMPRGWSALSEADQRRHLRDHHHRISAEMVVRSVDATEPPIGFHLTNEFHPGQTAALCEAHCVDLKAERYGELTRPAPRLRMPLLAALLRLADVLDESRRRAKRERARTLELDLLAQSHWWRHYYTRDVTFDHAGTLVVLHYEFPPGRRAEFAPIVPQLQRRWIEREFDHHRVVLNQNGLHWNLSEHIETPAYCTAETMPDDVLAYMLRELKGRRAAEAEAQRLDELRAFAEAQPVLRRRREELAAAKASLDGAGYLRRAYQLASDAYGLGATRSAISILREPLDKEGSRLPPRECLAMAIDLAGWMRETDNSFGAVVDLANFQKLAEGPEDLGELKWKFWHLFAQCLNDEAKHAEADSAMANAIAAAGSADRPLLEIELEEWRLLRGSGALAEAARSAAGTTGSDDSAARDGVV